MGQGNFQQRLPDRTILHKPALDWWIGSRHGERAFGPAAHRFRIPTGEDAAARETWNVARHRHRKRCRYRGACGDASAQACSGVPSHSDGRGRRGWGDVECRSPSAPEAVPLQGRGHHGRGRLLGQGFPRSVAEDPRRNGQRASLPPISAFWPVWLLCLPWPGLWPGFWRELLWPKV